MQHSLVQICVRQPPRVRFLRSPCNVILEKLVELFTFLVFFNLGGLPGIVVGLQQKLHDFVHDGVELVRCCRLVLRVRGRVRGRRVRGRRARGRRVRGRWGVKGSKRVFLAWRLVALRCGPGYGILHRL